MENNLTVTMLVDQSPKDVYEAINNVSTWWSEEFTGASHYLHDEFEVRFADIHYSRHKVVELIPGKKVVWLTTDSRLNFIEDKTEWTGTTLIFDIARKGDKTQISFTHEGLYPACECYQDCSHGWRHYLEGSLVPYITSGKGNPYVLEGEIPRRAV